MMVGGAISVSAGLGFLGAMIGCITYAEGQRRLYEASDRALKSQDHFLDFDRLYTPLISVTGFLAGVGLAAGTTLLILDSRDRRKRTRQVSLAPQLHQPGAVLRVSF